MIILGINSAYHESSVALVVDGQLRFFLEEERVTRKKHGKSARVDNPHELPLAALSQCLKWSNLTMDDIDHVAYSFAEEGRRRNIGVDSLAEPRGWGTVEGEELFHRCLQKIPESLAAFGARSLAGRFHWVPHHLAHAASAFFCSPFDEALVAAVDGIGEFDSLLVARGEGNRIRSEFSLPYPHSLGLLWEKFCIYLGFSEYDACKVMGLASYGDPIRFKQQISRFAKTTPESPLSVDGDLIRFRSHDLSSLEEVFGPARPPNGEFQPHHHDVAATLQDLTNRVLSNLVESATTRTPWRNLCLAGGVALNCVTNANLAGLAGSRGFFVQPAAHDAGSALGAALWVWHHELHQPRGWVLEDVYQGPSYDGDFISRTLKASGLAFEALGNPAETAADLIAAGSIVGWFQGRMEMGPRALGNRSLLADPRRADMRETLNRKVKHRESFRPFAPSILAEEVSAWFDSPLQSQPSEFMLMTLAARPDCRSKIPAVLHVDGTSRIHAVHRHRNPMYHALIRRFADRTGVPLVLNTSFNDSEPIVMTPEDAIKTFCKTRIDALVMGEFLVHRSKT